MRRFSTVLVAFCVAVAACGTRTETRTYGASVPSDHPLTTNPAAERPSKPRKVRPAVRHRATPRRKPAATRATVAAIPAAPTVPTTRPPAPPVVTNPPQPAPTGTGPTPISDARCADQGRPDIGALIDSVFGPAGPWAQSVAVRESHCDPAARHPEGASGIFQMMLPLHSAIFRAVGCDPVTQWADAGCNVRAAFLLYQGSGTAPWRL